MSVWFTYGEWLLRAHREDDVVADDMPPVCDIEYGCATGIRNVCVCVCKREPAQSNRFCERVCARFFECVYVYVCRVCLVVAKTTCTCAIHT